MTPAIDGLGEATPEDLHPQQRENEDEQEEDHQQRVDGGDGVDQGLHQVPHGSPVPAWSGREVGDGSGRQRPGARAERYLLRLSKCLLPKNKSSRVFHDFNGYGG